MAAITTGKETPTATSRKDSKRVFDTTNSVFEPILPVAETKPFVYKIPTADSSTAKNQVLPLKTTTSYFTLGFRGLLFVFKLVDTALSYLRYPLLGLVILAFLYGHLSDVYPHDDSTAPSTTTLTTTMTQTRTSTLLPTSSKPLSISSRTAGPLILEKESFPRPSGESTIELPTFPISQNPSAVDTELGSDEDASTMSPPEDASQANEEYFLGKNSVSSVEGSPKSVETSSKTSTSFSKASPLIGTVVGRARSSTQKKRMYT